MAVRTARLFISRRPDPTCIPPPGAARGLRPGHRIGLRITTPSHRHVPKKKPNSALAEWGSRIQQSKRLGERTDRWWGALPRGRISTPEKLSRFPGSRLDLLSAPSHPASSGTVACADFNAAYSCGAAMDSPSLAHCALRGIHHFPSGSPDGDHTQPRLFTCCESALPQSTDQVHNLTPNGSALYIRSTLRSQAHSSSGILLTEVSGGR